MNTAEIKHILQSPYERNNWLRFLVYVANQNNNRLKNTLHIQDLSSQFENKSYPILTLLKIGTYHTSDRQPIPIYEVGLKDSVRIEKNRVGVNQFIKNIVLKQQGSKAALCVFKYQSNLTSEWRFSFVSKFASSQFFSDIAAKETHPKRYTYIFGTPEVHRTAIQCFQNLKNSSFNIQDFFDAFSIEKVSKDFFDGYKVHHQTLVDEISNITANYTTVFNNNDKAVIDFSKRLLGRIVFLYFLQKKHWLGSSSLDYNDGDPDFLFTLFKESKCTEDGSDYYLHKLTELFFDTLNNQNREKDNYSTPSGRIVKVPYLNGGLFDSRTEPKGHELLIIPNWVFLRLFEFLNQYNFTIDESNPIEHNVAVDPEMMGNIFEDLNEERKEKGAFYTPKEIVHYMCQESLIEYLTTHLSKNYTVYKEIGKGQVELFGNETKTGQLTMVESIGGKALDKVEIEHIVRNKDITKLSDVQLSTMDSLLDNVKICDPAIGSGAFPMGLLQEIFAIKELIAYQTKAEWKPAEVKANIIQNSIYGVDIEQGAVDIAQLRFWLSLVVDEDLPSPLPNLDYKIVTGNSIVTKFNDEVIEIDWDTNTTKEGLFGQLLIEEKIDLLKDLADKQKLYFDADTKIKEKLQKEIRHLTLQVLEKQLQLTIETKGFGGRKDGKQLTKKQAEQLVQTKIWEKTLQDIKALKKNEKDFSFFDWKLSFPEVLNPYLIKDEDKQGFDILIANPPYIKEYTNRSAFDGFRDSPYYQGKMDIWYGFACVGIDLIKPNGVECFIAQNNWVTSSGASKLREKILTETELQIFTDFWDFKVFKSAGIQTMIYLLKRTKKPQERYTTRYSKLTHIITNSSLLESFLKGLSNSTDLDFEKYKIEFVPSDYTENYITFSNPKISLILKTIEKKGTLRLKESEVATGIQPNPDVINSRNIKRFSEQEIIDNNIKVGDGVFVIPKGLFDHLDIDEKQYIKPNFNPKNIERYNFDEAVESEIIYITKKNYHNNAPNILKHLGRYSKVMDARRENQNGRLEYYHLQWPRDERFFKKGKKILSIRKCDKPCFIYTEEAAYVMLTFNIIKTDRIDLKYLTALLNSKLVEFWLRYKGKMQGNNFQIDKEPLVNIPIIKPESDIIFSTFVDYIIFLKSRESNEKDLELRSLYFEQIIDGMVYELYFPELLKQYNRSIFEHLGGLPEFKDDMNDDEKLSITTKAYDRLSHKSHPVAINLYYLNTIPEITIIEGKS